MRGSRCIIACGGWAAALLLAACGVDTSGLGSIPDASVADTQQTGDDVGTVPDSGNGLDGTAQGDSRSLDAPLPDAPQDVVASDSPACLNTPTSCGVAGVCTNCTTSPALGNQCVNEVCGCMHNPDCAMSTRGPTCIGSTCGCTKSTDCMMGQACNQGVCTTSCAGGATCNGGCCDGTNTCQPGTASGACGKMGTCATCGGGTPTCAMNGTCSATCFAGACGLGFCCVAGNTCATNDGPTGCGLGCTDCTMPGRGGPVCVNGGCGCNVPMDCMNSPRGTYCPTGGGTCGCNMAPDGGASSDCTSSPNGHTCISVIVANVCGCNSTNDCPGPAMCNLITHQCG